MARFRGTHQESFTVDRPVEAVQAHFSDLDMIVRHYGPIQRSERLDDDTLRLTLQEKGAKGIRYQAIYTVRYERSTPGLLRWSTLQSENLWSSGEARFSAAGAGGTRVDYQQTIETEIPVPRLLAGMAEGLVRNEIIGGVKAYLGRMRAAATAS
jgi:uncharacterized membrane protein